MFQRLRPIVLIRRGQCSPVMPFVYLTHYREFFVWHQQHSVWGLRLSSRLHQLHSVLHLGMQQPIVLGVLGEEQTKPLNGYVNWIVTLHRSACRLAGPRMFHRNGRTVYLHPSAFWCTFATREGALHTTCLWYRSAFFSAILITITEPSHRHMTVTFPPKDGTIQSPRPTYKHKQ